MVFSIIIIFLYWSLICSSMTMARYSPVMPMMTWFANDGVQEHKLPAQTSGGTGTPILATSMF